MELYGKLAQVAEREEASISYIIRRALRREILASNGGKGAKK